MTILIRNGILADPSQPVRRADVLIEGDTIKAVGSGLTGDETIDATGRLVIPGLIDTHRHTWQAPLRGSLPNATLGDYIHQILGTIGPRYRPEDVYAANLAGALDALDSGVTTLLDWSHIQNTPQHSDAAIQGLRDSGIRAVFGHGTALPMAVEKPHPADARRIRTEQLPADDGLITMALAINGPEFGPLDVAEADIRFARELGLRVTVHVTRDAGVEGLHDRGLLGPDITFVHGNGLGDAAIKLISAFGGSASVSPLIEAQLGFGPPAIVRLRAQDVPVSLSVDTVTATSGDLFAQMRAAFAFARTEDPSVTAADVLGMATRNGAIALGLEDRVGALTPGRQADVVLLRTDTLAMAPGGDPVGAVVTGADRAAVDTVLVAGQVVKRDGRLVSAGVRRALGLLGETAAHLEIPAR